MLGNCFSQFCSHSFSGCFYNFPWIHGNVATKGETYQRFLKINRLDSFHNIFSNFIWNGGKMRQQLILLKKISLSETRLRFRGVTKGCFLGEAKSICRLNLPHLLLIEIELTHHRVTSINAC